MQIALLSGGDGWHIRDLMRAASELGHSAMNVDFRRISAAAGSANTGALPFDAVIVRTMPPGSLEQVVFRMDLLHAWQRKGIGILNPPRALEICVDKFLCTAQLEAAGLRVPATIVCQHADAAFEAFDQLAGDVVVKPIFGSEGRGMIRVSDKELAWRTFRTIERTQSVLYLQEFIPHPGWDVRAFVSRGRVLTSMRRIAKDDWRTNVAQGATAEPWPLPREQESLALRAAEAVGTIVAGVDLLPGPNGEWYVIEVNAVPGWKALAPATGIDVARTHRHRGWAGAMNDIAHCALTACLWEVSAHKAGNVHRFADFDDLTYLDFVLSAAAMAPVLQTDLDKPLGVTVIDIIRATRGVVRTNTNLGIALLLAPLSKCEPVQWRSQLEAQLANTTIDDARNVYEAIRLANPGGLGKVDDQDVADEPTQTLREVMTLAADRDMVARQYANGFRDVLEQGVPALLDGWRQFASIEAAILHLQICLLASYPDSLIVRKRGTAEAEQVHSRAREIDLSTADGKRRFVEFDRWLREHGQARNPGTTADLVAACLFAALRRIVESAGAFRVE